MLRLTFVASPGSPRKRHPPPMRGKRTSHRRTCRRNHPRRRPRRIAQAMRCSRDVPHDCGLAALHSDAAFRPAIFHGIARGFAREPLDDWAEDAYRQQILTTQARSAMQTNLGTNLPAVLRARAAETPDRIYVVDVDDRSLTYQEMTEWMDRWAAAYRRVGVERGECVVTMQYNTIESLAGWLGLAAIG